MRIVRFTIDDFYEILRSERWFFICLYLNLFTHDLLMYIQAVSPLTGCCMLHFQFWISTKLNHIYFTLAVRFNNHLIRWNSKFLLPSYQSTLFRIRNTPEVVLFYTFPQITDISLARWSTANQTNCAQSIFYTRLFRTIASRLLNSTDTSTK